MRGFRLASIAIAAAATWFGSSIAASPLDPIVIKVQLPLLLWRLSPADILMLNRVLNFSTNRMAQNCEFWVWLHLDQQFMCFSQLYKRSRISA